jgi:hypothetical protein
MHDEILAREGTSKETALDFPHVGQVVLIERESIKTHTGEHTDEMALGLTSRTPKQASPQRVLAVTTEKDRRRIRTGFGPEHITRLRRFAVGILTSFQKSAPTIAEMLRTRCVRTRLVFDDVRMTNTSVTGARAA